MNIAISGSFLTTQDGTRSYFKARSTMPAAAVRNATIAVVGQEQHLVFPRVRSKRPAMAEVAHSAHLSAKLVQASTLKQKRVASSTA